MAEYDPNKVAKRRGWDQTSYRTEAYNPRAPRLGFRWNEKEDQDLIDSWQTGSRNIMALSTAHGRSAGGISSRLEFLGLSDEDPVYKFAESKPTEAVLRQLLLDEKFKEFEAYCNADLNQLPIAPNWPKRFDLSQLPGLQYHMNCRCVVKPLTENLENKMQLTTNRLMVLLAIHRGTFANELTCGTTGADVATLVNAKLVIQSGTSVYNLSLTAAGSKLVTSMANYATGLTGGASTTYALAPAEDQPSDGVFLVACGDSDLSDTRLTKAPRVKHKTESEATAEAIRLATANEGKEFLVFKAISSHATRSPVVSTRL